LIKKSASDVENANLPVRLMQFPRKRIGHISTGKNVNQFKWPDEMRYTTSSGRGTEECKTNDRTGRFKRGQVGVVGELGRPNTGTYLYTAEKIIQLMRKAGAELEEKSPMTAMISDKKKGLLREDIRNERFHVRFY